MPELPCTVRMRENRSRMSPWLSTPVVLDIVTSDELAIAMAKRRPRWEIRRAVVTNPPGTDDLKLLAFTSCEGAPFLPPPKQVYTRPRGDEHVPAKLSCCDPFQHGRSQNAEFSQEVFPEDTHSVFHDLLAEHLCDEDIVREMAEEDAAETFLGEMHPGAGEAFKGYADNGGDLDGILEALTAVQTEESLVQAVAHSEKEAGGRILCPFGPWAEWNPLGVHKIWPAPWTVTEDKQWVAVDCMIHPGCRLVRRRLAWSDQQMLWWLLKGLSWFDPSASHDEQRRNAKAHMDFGKDLPEPPAEFAGEIKHRG